MNHAAMLHPQAIGALVALINQDKLREAERQADALLKLHPDVGMLWKILSVALARQGKAALSALQRAAELLPQDAEAHRNLGAALHDKGQWALALVSLQRALALRPDDPDALVDAANSMRGLGMVRDAVPLYRRALELDPHRAEAHNNLGNAFLELGRTDDAARCYCEALRLRPDDADILCNLGGAQRRLGRLDDALVHSRRAVEVAPDSSAAHNNLGLVMSALGRREDAMACYRQALTLEPANVDALNNLGGALRDLGARREALAVYARAIAAAPARAVSHCNLGTALFELRRVDEAMTAWRHALELQPDHAPAHFGLSLAFRQRRRPAEAEASCRKALAIDPHYVEAISLLGELKADRGQFAEAGALFLEAIRINPNFSFAFSSIATHRKMTADDTAWLEGAQSLLARPLPLGQEIGLRYSLGKYFDDVGRHDEAFLHYRQANELTKRYGASHDREKLGRRVDQMIRTFTAEVLARPLPQASASDMPVFIIGMPRSGTSLAEQIIASHPAVFGAGELTFWNIAYEAYRDAGPECDHLIPGMVDDYLAQLTASSGDARRIVDKLPANFLHVGLIHRAFPRARIIHMQRHPFDTCLSIYFQNFFNIGPYAHDLNDLAHYYSEYLRLTNHWRAALPPGTLLEVSYEALVQDQEASTRRMLDFLDLPWDPKCLDFHRTDRVVITASKWQVRQKISASSVGRWRNYERHLGPLRQLQGQTPDAAHG